MRIHRSHRPSKRQIFDARGAHDRYWTTLSEGGEEGPCGWLKDRFGLSWQVVPKRLMELVTDPDREKGQRAMAAMLGMRKIEIAELERAADEVES